jgi:RHS repeat-associated protein
MNQSDLLLRKHQDCPIDEGPTAGGPLVSSPPPEPFGCLIRTRFCDGWDVESSDLNPTGYAQVIEEVVGGAVQREYTYGLQRISQYQLISGVWTASFYGYDGGGSVRQLTNSSGAITDTYNYDAFGNKLNSTGTTPNNYLYRGEQYDPDLGLYYLRARYYNPLTGRFMSRDPEDGMPLSPKTLHKYLYAGGDPVNVADASGRDFFEFLGRTAQIVAYAATVVGAASFSYCLYKEATAISGALSNMAPPDNLPQQVLQCTVDLLKSIINPPFFKLF